MSVSLNIGFEVEARGELLIVTKPAAEFFAIYTKASDKPHLILKRRTDTEDHALLAQAWQAANAKARELGWIA
jgi:hypothetical protein